jgi:hypothetical protein
MKKAWIIGSVVVAVGLVGTGIAFAITSVGTPRALVGASSDPSSVGAADIPTLVLIDRLQLSRDQMQKVHDILAQLVDELTAFQTKRQALADDLLAFSGTEEELNQKLEDFKADLGTPLRDAIKQLGDVLTYRQGTLLQQTLKTKLSRLADKLAAARAAAPALNAAPRGAGILDRLGLRGESVQTPGLTSRGALLNGLRAGRAQTNQGQGLLRITQQAQAAAERLERVVKLLELKLGQPTV